MMSKYHRFPVGCHLALAVGLLLIAPSRARAEVIEHPPDASEVFHCAFDQTWDVNYDAWPDRWIRKTGTGYPNYVDIQIRDADDPEAAGGRYLEFNLDGSAAAVAS